MIPRGLACHGRRNRDCPLAGLSLFLVFSLMVGSAPALALRQVGLEEGKKADLVSALQSAASPASRPTAGLEERTAALRPEAVRIWVVAPALESREVPGGLTFQRAIQSWLPRAADPQLRKIPPDHVEIMDPGRRAYSKMAARLSERTHQPTLIIAAYSLGEAGTGLDVANAVRQARVPNDQRPAVLVVSPYSLEWEMPQTRALHRAVSAGLIVGHAKMKVGDNEFPGLYQAMTDYLAPRLTPPGRVPAARAATAGLEEQPGEAEKAAPAAEWPTMAQELFTGQRDKILEAVRQHAERHYVLSVYVEPSLLTPQDSGAHLGRLRAIEQRISTWLGVEVFLLARYPSTTLPNVLWIVRDTSPPVTGWAVTVRNLPTDQRLPDDVVPVLILAALLAPDQSSDFDAAQLPASKAGLEDLRRTLDEIFT